MLTSVWLIGCLYEMMVRLYPRDFRASFGDEMIAVFADAVVETAESGSGGLLALCLRELKDWPRSLLREHWSSLRVQIGEVLMTKMVYESHVPGLIPAHQNPVTQLVGSITAQNTAIKRMCDVVFAVAGLVLAAPLLAVVAVLVKLDSPGPALFRQERVGRDGRLFTLYKFRSMVCGADKMVVPANGVVGENASDRQEDDPRLTPVGRVIRILKVDELPQLINVLRGEMSLLGPRPERPAR